MTRAARNYGDRAAHQAFAGVDVTEPKAGFYRYRLRSGAVRGGVRLYFGPPLDPVTGEELDRSWRWQADFDGQPVDLDEVWPACAGEPITEQEYRDRCDRREWAREAAPKSAHAQPTKRIDLLSTNELLPF